MEKENTNISKWALALSFLSCIPLWLDLMSISFYPYELFIITREILPIVSVILAIIDMVLWSDKYNQKTSIRYSITAVIISIIWGLLLWLFPYEIRLTTIPFVFLILGISLLDFLIFHFGYKLYLYMKKPKEKRPKEVKKTSISNDEKPKKNKAFGGFNEKGQAIFLFVILILFAIDYLVMTVGSFIRKNNIAGGFFILLFVMFFVPYKKELSRAYKRILAASKAKEQETTQELKEQIKKELLEELTEQEPAPEQEEE